MEGSRCGDPLCFGPTAAYCVSEPVPVLSRLSPNSGSYLTLNICVAFFSAGFEPINHREASRALRRHRSEAWYDTLSTLRLINTRRKDQPLSSDVVHFPTVFVK